MNDIQKELLSLLIEFDKFCCENHLKYHIFYGTLLGAVRHKGFIPWDDDIDVLMPLEDYSKFLKMQKKLKNTLFLQSIETDNSYFYLFAKLKYKESKSLTTKEDILYNRQSSGAWIDIFPCIPIPSINQWSFKIWKKKRLHLATILALKSIPFKKARAIKKIIKPIVAMLPRKLIVNKINKLSYKFAKKEYKLLYVQDFWSPDERLILNNYSFNDSIRLSFENYSFIAPKDYDNVLTDYYGDYMTPPPVDRREGHK